MPAEPDSPGRPLRVLEFTLEGPDGYRHPSAHTQDEVIAEALRARGHHVRRTDDAKVLIAALPHTDVVLFFSTSGTVFSPAERVAFEAYIRRGGGFSGVHTASATESQWPFYHELVGARFLGHAAGASQLSTAEVFVDATAPAMMSEWPRRFSHRDEWYYFVEDPAKNAALTPLLLVDEQTLPDDYPSEGRYGRHLVAWRQSFAGGRSFYTALGHDAQAYHSKVLDLIVRGTEWAGALRAQSSP